MRYNVHVKTYRVEQTIEVPIPLEYRHSDEIRVLTYPEIIQSFNMMCSDKIRIGRMENLEFIGAPCKYIDYKDEDGKVWETVCHVEPTPIGYYDTEIARYHSRYPEMAFAQSFRVFHVRVSSEVTWYSNKGTDSEFIRTAMQSLWGVRGSMTMEVIDEYDYEWDTEWDD